VRRRLDPLLSDLRLAATWDMVVNLIGNRIDHHAGHSGYDQLARYLADRMPVRTLADYMSPLIGDWAWWWIAHRSGPWVARRSGMEWYETYSLSLEMAAAARFVSGRNAVYHYLYGENTYRYLGGLSRIGRRRNNKIVCSYHQPPEILDRILHFRAMLDRLDAVIVVASNQVSYFESVLGSDRVFLIPHGVDTDFYHPPVRLQSDDIRCLFVGKWLRDFKTLHGVARNLAVTDPAVRFTIITDPVHATMFKDQPNVTVLSLISDAALLEAYHTSDLLLLPLEDCTANGALLDGLACGLPVVATDIGGIRDYIDDSCGFLTPAQDVESMSRAIRTLASSPELRATMSQSSRNRALSHDWRRIVNRFVDVYEGLLN